MHRVLPRLFHGPPVAAAPPGVAKRTRLVAERWTMICQRYCCALIQRHFVAC